MTTTQLHVEERPLSNRKLLLLLTGLLTTMFLSTLDQTVVSTATRAICDQLGGLSQQAWLSTVFLLTSTLATPISGRLSDLFGRRIVFTACLFIFSIGSLACGLSATMLSLILCRGLQGVGAGGLTVLPLTVIADLLPPRTRAKFQGCFLSVIAVATVCGPLWGGLLAGSPSILGIAGWRWVFLFNVPIALISLCLVYPNLRYKQHLQAARIDWLGCAFLAVFMVPLLLVAKQGSIWGWTSSTAWACYFVAAIGVILFGWVEHRQGDTALLPLEPFRNRSFLLASLIGVVVGFTMLGGFSIIPLYAQITRGATPLGAGLILLPAVAGMMAATLGSGQIIARIGRFGILPQLGTALLAISLTALCFTNINTSMWMILTATAGLGMGVGLLTQTMTLISQNAVPSEQIGIATSTATFVRSIGSAFGAGILIAAIFNQLPAALSQAFKGPSLSRQLAAALRDPTVTHDLANRPIINVLKDAGQHGGASLTTAMSTDTSFLTHADHRLSAPFLTAFNTTTVAALHIAAFIAILGFVLCLFLRPAPLRDPTHPNIQKA